MAVNYRHYATYGGTCTFTFGPVLPQGTRQEGAGPRQAREQPVGQLEASNVHPGYPTPRGGAPLTVSPKGHVGR